MGENSRNNAVEKIQKRRRDWGEGEGEGERTTNAQKGMCNKPQMRETGTKVHAGEKWKIGEKVGERRFGRRTSRRLGQEVERGGEEDIVKLEQRCDGEKKNEVRK